MFNLLRYFSVASACAIIFATIAVVSLYRQSAIEELINSAERQNIALARSFANVIWPRFSQHIKTVGTRGASGLRSRTQEIDQSVRVLTSGLSVLKVKIYDINGLTVYSSQFSQIGESKLGNKGYTKAVKLGIPVSKMSFRDTFSSFSGEVTGRDLVESYIPIRGAKNQVEGVFELYTDVTLTLAKVDRRTNVFTAGFLLALIVLYGLLILIVRRADRIIKDQYTSLELEIDKRERLEQKLVQAQKMEAVGQLTGGIAHDFNNLLAVILGNAEILAETQEADQGSLQSIIRSATRGADLTQRLLAFSRQQPLHPRPTDMSALVAGMRELLRRTLGENIRITSTSVPDLWAAKADSGQLENALLNLAINARDAMPDGGELTIKCFNTVLDADYVEQNPEIDAGEYVVIEVRDEGTGIPAEVLEHVYEPFYTTKEVGQGSGLGLSMVYGFAKQSDGNVTIDSVEGSGTTVRLFLPRAEVITQSSGVEKSSLVPFGANEVVLLVEDDEDVRGITQSMLQGIGYSVIATASAASALAILQNDKIDLVLSDVVLAESMNGPKFVKQARTTHPDLKVVYMSGYAPEKVLQNYPLSLDEFILKKPFRSNDLARIMRQALGKDAPNTRSA